MIIGLTGKNASGKGEVADFLKKAGFLYYSLSDVLREELKKQNLSITRENLLEQGLNLREKYGAGVLAYRILNLLEVDKNYVIDSFRNPVEVEVFKTQDHFHLIHVSALPYIRFDRIKRRMREGDPQNLEEFERLEKREAHSNQLAGQQLEATAKLADIEIENNDTLEGLHQRTRDVLNQISASQTRPDWDHYFMNIAKMVALRSNCIKRKVAALLVKDKRIIATGYNGTPRGVKNCNEGGCPRCNQFAPSGSSLDECYCSHAEENAITQSAYHGVSIKGATLYTTFSPCMMCTKMIINSGITEVVYSKEYPLGDTAIKLLHDAELLVRKIQIV